MSRGLLFCGMLSGVVMLSSAWAGDYDNQGFEAPAFQPGNLAGQDGWQMPDVGGTPDGAVVESAVGQDGSQAVVLRNTDQRVLIRKVAKNDGAHWIDITMLPPRKEAIVTNLSINLRGKTGTGEYGILATVSLNGSGSVNGLPAKPEALYRKEDWNRLTIHIKPEEGTYDLYLNDVLAGAGLSLNGGPGAGMVDAYEVDWTGASAYAESSPVIDRFTITEETPLRP